MHSPNNECEEYHFLKREEKCPSTFFYLDLPLKTKSHTVSYKLKLELKVQSTSNILCCVMFHFCSYDGVWWLLRAVKLLFLVYKNTFYLHKNVYNCSELICNVEDNNLRQKLTGRCHSSAASQWHSVNMWTLIQDITDEVAEAPPPNMKNQLWQWRVTWNT